MKKNNFSLVLGTAFLLSVSLISCQSDNSEEEINSVDPAVLAKLDQLGFDTSDTFESTFNGKQGYVVERDIFLTKQ